MRYGKICGSTGFLQKETLLITYRLRPGNLVLVDTGSRRDERLVGELTDDGWTVRAILNTHLHPDHIANNHLLQTRHHAAVWAAEGEIRFIQDTEAMAASYTISVEQAAAISGCFDQSRYAVVPIGPEDLPLCVEGCPFQVLHLPGHSVDHLGFVTPEGVCCVGDALLSDELIDSAKLPYFYDLPAYFRSLGKLSRTRYPFYAMGHNSLIPGEHLVPLIVRNIEKEIGVLGQIRALLTGPAPYDTFLVQVMRAFQIMESHFSTPFLLRLVRPYVDCLLQWDCMSLQENHLLCPGSRPVPSAQFLSAQLLSGSQDTPAPCGG